MSENGLGGPSSDSTDSGKDFSCDYCERSFGSQQALNSHVGQVHPKENKIVEDCLNCGDEVSRPTSRAKRRELTFCSRECWEEYQPKVMSSGKDHPNYSKITVSCDYCGKEHDRLECKIEGRDYLYCSRECHSKHAGEIDRFTGKDNPQYNSKTITCDRCNSQFTAPLSQIKDGRRFCSTDCFHGYMSEHMSGENSPLYKGHSDITYGQNWNGVREKTRTRDNYTCQDCGVTEQEYDRELDVHHITPIREFETPEQANQLNNLVSLCRSCHQKWEGIPVRPQ